MMVDEAHDYDPINVHLTNAREIQELKKYYVAMGGLQLVHLVATIALLIMFGILLTRLAAMPATIQSSVERNVHAQIQPFQAFANEAETYLSSFNGTLTTIDDLIVQFTPCLNWFSNYCSAGPPS